MASLVSTFADDWRAEGSAQGAVRLIHTTLIERESASMQESMMCPHMIDPISVLSSLPYPTDHTLPKLRIGFDGDPRTTARGLEDLMVS